jgi:hypothetical protein
MRRSSPWLMLVVALLGVLIWREPRLQQGEDFLLGWLLEYSAPVLTASKLTLVEISRDDFAKTPATPGVPPAPAEADHRPKGRGISPLEYALFLQSVLELKPPVIAVESVVKWRERDKDQEQIFIDQAMRAPKLLLATELSTKQQEDAPVEEMPTFWGVEGSRNRLPSFSGFGNQPDEDLRLIATPGFINMPSERTNRVRVPMLFLFRGEVVASFPLQAVMLWLGATPAEVKIDLGSQITLPNGWKIPIRADGTTTINPSAANQVRRLKVTDILLAAQERDMKEKPTLDLNDLSQQIVLLRAADDPLQAPNSFAAAIATIQNNAFVRRAGSFFDLAAIAAAVMLAAFIWSIGRFEMLLGAIAFTAAFSMTMLGLLSRQHLWLPGFLPLVLLWFLVAVRLMGERAQRIPREPQN